MVYWLCLYHSQLWLRTLQVGGTNNVGGIAGSVAVDAAGVSTLTVTAPSSSNYGTITGSSNQVAITQHGDANSAQYNIKGNQNVYTSTVTGNGNQTKLSIGDTNTNGLRNTVTETITGNTNMTITNIVGSDKRYRPQLLVTATNLQLMLLQVTLI